MNLNNKTVLVTGASSGLGYEMAYQLAVNYGTDVIIVARRETKLQELKEKIAAKSTSKVHILAADLSQSEEVKKVIDYSLAAPDFSGAILNAGITHFGLHSDLEWDYFEKMLNVNVKSVVRMTDAFFDYFNKKEGDCRLMIVSSMASLYPVPFQSAYSGTKGFLTNFANALSQEITNTRFKLSAYCPGGIKTEMSAGEEFDSLRRYIAPVEKVAATGLKGFVKGKMVFVPGLLNNITGIIARLIPRSTLVKQTGNIYRKALNKK